MQEILVIGAGNLSWHLVQVLQRAEFDVTLVSRNPVRVADWPVRIQAISDVSSNPSLIILAVPDGAIHQVSTELASYFPSDTPVIHTSGATPTVMINSHFAHRGALWPIRSLRSAEPVTDWRDVPLVYHGTNAALAQVLGEVTGKLSDLTYELNDAQRARLHLSAVFSNNFVTALLQTSFDICQQHDIPFEIILALFKNHANEMPLHQAPRVLQTGPASRDDQVTIDSQTNMLQDPLLKNIYLSLSDLIKSQKKIRLKD